MTTAPREPRRRATRDPYGLMPKGTPIAAILARRRGSCWSAS